MPTMAICCNNSHAEEVRDPNVLAIIGEAENQGFRGMLAVAGAIRNRGTLKGVYGTRSKRVKNTLYSEKTYRIAQQAWLDSAEIDITEGATMWENVVDFGKPYWADSLTKTVVIGSHQFYK